MNVAETVSVVEAAGVALRLEGQKVRVSYCREEQRQDLARHVALLRANRDEVAAFLLARATIPEMPRGVFLVAWTLKEPPVAIETCAVVTDSALFARATLEQLRHALTRRCWVGWSIPQLVERLAQVGVLVALKATDTTQ